MDAEHVATELVGLRRLARSLASGDADDLLQDAAVDALQHGGDVEEPRSWLAAILKNRWRMTRRAQIRRVAREDGASDLGPRASARDPDEMLDRARGLSRLAEALVALDEPFRATVIARYFDGESAADIARRMGVPAGTVRWRLKTGIDRLRAAIDPPTLRAIAPLALHGAVMTTKSKVIAAIAVALVVALWGGWRFVLRGAGDVPDNHSAAPPPPPKLAVQRPEEPHDLPPATPAVVAAEKHGRAEVADGPAAGGVVRGRVINWSTGDGVEGAELTFAGSLGAMTVRTGEAGAFEVAPDKPGQLVLATVSKPGFLPYAPEYGTSSVRLALVANRVVSGVTVYLFPALDYHGVVVDKTGAPVAGAKVALLGTPYGEQEIDKLQTEWTSDAKGEFVFHAADDAVLEATMAGKRGLAQLDRNVQLTKLLVIRLGDLPPRDQTIAGIVVDTSGTGVPDVLVRALPDDGAVGPPVATGVHDDAPRATMFATTGPDGKFSMKGTDREIYGLQGTSDGFAPSPVVVAKGGDKNVKIVLDQGAELAGVVQTSEGAAVPSYTLLVVKKIGAGRQPVVDKTVIDPAGKFSVRVPPDGDYELTASAAGWAPSMQTTAKPGDKVTLVVTPGATLKGFVSSATGGPVAYARVTREARGGGASAAPANAGTVTKTDGSFELTGIPPGLLSISIGADSFHPKIEALGTAHDGETLGPIAITLAPLAPGEEPKVELVGIGVQLGAEGGVLRIQKVIAGGGAASAGIVAGDEMVSVDGAMAAELGVDGAVAKIRGVEGTTVAIGIKRKDIVQVLMVERRKLRA